MPDYIIRSRKTGATTDSTVTAESREQAILQVAQSGGPGEEVEVMQVKEVPGTFAGPGTTGTTGGTGATGR